MISEASEWRIYCMEKHEKQKTKKRKEKEKFLKNISGKRGNLQNASMHSRKLKRREIHILDSYKYNRAFMGTMVTFSEF